MSTQPFDFPPTGNPLVDQALQRLSARTDRRFQDIEDAMLVQARAMLVQSQIESRMAAILERQAGLLDSHSKLQAQTTEAIQRHEKWLQDWKLR